jgi:pimeloyl-ACP methyl ester carboxylesterase
VLLAAALGASLGPAAASDVGQPHPLSALGATTSPFEPPKADDRTFMINSGGGLDTGCTFRSGGPLVIQIPVTRYAGPTNPDGTLQNAAALVAAGLLSRFANLTLPAYDVDFNTPTMPPDQPERDRVSFNGTPVAVLFRGNPAFLQGSNNIWLLNSFQIPIEKVKFPSARGAAGEAPTPAMNELVIDIDVANAPQGTELWCTAIDWASLDIKIMSPVILIHGNNSDGGFFARQGFTAGLTSQRLLWDNSISMATASVAAHSVQLDQLIPPIVKSFGVDSVHLIVHSKGGLDSRDYLARYQASHDDTFKVLSLTTLSTPHNGSVLADVAMTRQAAAARASYVEFNGFPGAANALAYLSGVDAGTPDLQTTTAAAFNAVNVSLLPGFTVYNATAADADQNGNARIDNAPDEYAELRTESASLRRIYAVNENSARGIVDVLYQILRNTSGVTVTFTRKKILGISYTVATLNSVPTAAPLGNDTLVTLPSGLGTGGYSGRTTNTRTFTGGAGRNHSSIANAGVATTVAPWLIAIESTKGDLK